MSIIKKILEERAAENLVELDEAAESALAKKAEKSGISLSTLKTVYKRGVAAWNSGHRPGTTPQQWGMARVNSYITKGKGTYHGADKDLREDLDEDSRLDNKAYHKGVSDSTAKARVAHWKKMDKLSDRDPRAYEPAPGDATAKTKESKHTKKYRELYGEEAVYLEDLDEQIEMLDEMPGANMDTRAVHQHLKKSGWSLTRTSGGHDIYTHPEAKHSIPVPRHRQLKAPLVLGILKSSKLRKEEKEVDELDTSDYKVDKAGRKYKAHKLVFNKGEEDMKEELKGNQHKLDVDKDGKIEGEDLAKLRKMKKEETELDEAVNAEKIKKDLDSGMSVDAVIGKHANKKLTNTGEIRKVIQQHMWNKRMKKEETELDERELSDAEMKERERIVKGLKKSYKDFASRYGSRAKSVMYATATKLAKEEFSEDILEELEQIQELSKSTLASYVKKASRNIGTRRALATTFDKNADSARNPATKEMNRKIAGDFTMDARKRVQGVDKAVERLAKEEVELDELNKSTLASYVKKASVNALSSGVSAGGTMASGDYKKGGERLDKGIKRTAGISKAVDRLAKEETEQIDEISKQLVARAYKKASDRSDLDLDDDMGEKAGKQADKFKARLSQHSPKREVPGRGTGSSKYGDDLNFPYRADAKETKKDGTLSKKAIHTSKWVANMKLSGLKNQPKPNLPEEFELDEEIKPYVSADEKGGWSVLDHKGKEVKKFHWKDYMDHPIKDKRKAAKDDAMAYFKKHYNSLRKPTNECIEEHLLDLCEAMIERDDFDDRVAAYKKSGFKVLDAKHSDMKAHISFVDGEGMHRTVKYTPTGKTMQNHGQYAGGEKDESGEKVNKSEVKTVKRGRGRPRKDKFAESVDILLSLTEEEFDEIMEDSSLDEIVESLCNLSEEELKELKGE